METVENTDPTDPTFEEMVGSLSRQVANLTMNLSAAQIKVQKQAAELGKRERKIQNLEKQVAKLKETTA